MMPVTASMLLESWRSSNWLLAGEVILRIYLNTRRFGIHVRYDERYCNDQESIRNILVHTSDGILIPLSQMADVKTVIGPIQINREKNQRRWIISGNVRGYDMGLVMGDIKSLVEVAVGSGGEPCQ